MNNQISIGIIDAYSQLNLDQCISSIPKELRNAVLVVSNTNNKIPDDVEHIKYTGEIGLSSLRNRCLTQFRLNSKIKYYFLITSNTAITDPDIFQNTIKTASVFGTWVMTGPGLKSIPIEDDVNNVTINLSPELNANFLFIYSNVLKNVGFFNEQMYCNEPLDVIDFIARCRKVNIYPPNHYNPTIAKGIFTSNTPSTKVKFNNEEKIQYLSYGFFHHLHKYVPGQGDPVGVTEEQALQALENIQKTYARSL